MNRTKFWMLVGMMVIGLMVSGIAQTRQGKTKQQGKMQMQVLTATASNHSVALTCMPPTTGTTPTGYFFYRGTTSGFYSAGMTPLNATEMPTCGYTDTTVLANTTYYYVATSNCSICNPSSMSGPSNQAQANVPADVAPNPPTGLTTGTISQNSVPLFWLAPQAQTGFKIASYKVYRGIKPTMPNPNLIATISPTLLKYTDTKCKVGTTCYYYVKAYDKNLILAKYQMSGPSNIVSAVGQ